MLSGEPTLRHSFTYCVMHTYSDSPNTSGTFAPLERVFKPRNGFYRDLYAVRSFRSLRHQQMHILRIPASILVVKKSYQSRWIFKPSCSPSRPVRWCSRLCSRSIALKMGFKPGTPVIGLATLSCRDHTIVWEAGG